MLNYHKLTQIPQIPLMRFLILQIVKIPQCLKSPQRGDYKQDLLMRCSILQILQIVKIL